MNRRSFLGMLGLAPVVAAGAATTAPKAFASGGLVEGYAAYIGELGPEYVVPASHAARLGRRISCIPGDLGERLYAEACGDGRKITVLLDGVEQPWAETADEVEGCVTRAVRTESGNFAVNIAQDEILRETVSGHVEIVIGEPTKVGRTANPHPAEPGNPET